LTHLHSRHVCRIHHVAISTQDRRTSILPAIGELMPAGNDKSEVERVIGPRVSLLFPVIPAPVNCIVSEMLAALNLPADSLNHWHINLQPVDVAFLLIEGVFNIDDVDLLPQNVV
jgi:hypothetical protein